MDDKPFDEISFIIDFENGNLDEDRIVAGFQHLIDSGMVWKLQGMYGRMADTLINSGKCHKKKA